MPAVPLSQVAVQLRPDDNVAVAARHLQPGLEIASNGHAHPMNNGINHQDVWFAGTATDRSACKC